MSLRDTPVRDAAWAAIDFEGTGAAPGQSDEAVQVGIAGMAAGLVPSSGSFRSYVRPEGRMTRAATAVHRITDEELEGAPPLVSLWPEIKSRLSGVVVVAHGAGTEKRFLRAFPMHGFGPWIDTLALARAFMPELPDHSLAEVVGACGLENDVRAVCPDLHWHDALFDAFACIFLLRHFIVSHELENLVVGQLAAPDAAVYYRERKMKRLAREVDFDVPAQDDVRFL